MSNVFAAAQDSVNLHDYNHQESFDVDEVLYKSCKYVFPYFYSQIILFQYHMCWSTHVWIRTSPELTEQDDLGS